MISNKLLLFLAFALVLSGCAVNSPFKDQIPTSPAYKCMSFGEGRGVVVDFIEGGPPNKIREDRPFSLNLKFANYFEDSKQINLKLQDNVDIEGFPNEGVEEAVTIDGASVDRDIFYGPGCRIMEEQGFAELGLGPYAYRDVEFDDEILFKGGIEYDAFVPASFLTCVFNPAVGVGTSCNARESYNSNQLGWKNSYAPVYVSNVKKELIGSKEEAWLSLDVSIRNDGGGHVAGEDALVDFTISSEGGLSFDCDSDSSEYNSGSGDHLTLNLKEDAAEIHCDSMFTIDRESEIDIQMSLEYSYDYPFDSGFIDLESVGI